MWMVRVTVPDHKHFLLEGTEGVPGWIKAGKHFKKNSCQGDGELRERKGLDY